MDLKLIKDKINYYYSAIVNSDQTSRNLKTGHFLEWCKKEPEISFVIETKIEVIIKNKKWRDEDIMKILKEINSFDEEEYISLSFLVLENEAKSNSGLDFALIMAMNVFRITDNYEASKKFNEFLSSFCNFLLLNIKETNLVLFLLYRYKAKIEWFKRDELYALYCGNTQIGENLLDKNLRGFLFDQGIDYPFSTPQSASGRPDVIYGLDTENPLILEIKVFYGDIDRIKRGINQIYRYLQDYNQNIGYLFIFNVGTNIIVFQPVTEVPPSINIGDKVIYFVVADINPVFESPSIGKIEQLSINKNDLIKDITI
jgi:hypothetical protein